MHRTQTQADADITSNATKETVQQMFKRCHPNY